MLTGLFVIITYTSAHCHVLYGLKARIFCCICMASLSLEIIYQFYNADQHADPQEYDCYSQPAFPDLASIISSSPAFGKGTSRRDRTGVEKMHRPEGRCIQNSDFFYSSAGASACAAAGWSFFWSQSLPSTKRETMKEAT